MHEQASAPALTRTVNAYAKGQGPAQGARRQPPGRDIREGLTAIISVRVVEPQFEGQTKSKLGNVSVRSLVEKATNEKLKEWLEEHPKEAKAVVTKATNAARARIAATQAARASAASRPSMGPAWPGKLPTARARIRASRSSTIVEGNSAGGSAKEARDPGPWPSCRSGARS